jgi:hypothetical protein
MMMMRSGVCVKCSAPTIFAKDDGISYGSGGSLYVHTGMISQAVPSKSFVCTTCGYYELYITEPKKLADVAQKWQQIPPSTP